MNIEKLNDFIHENLVNRKNTTPYGLLELIAKRMIYEIKIPDRNFPAIQQELNIDRIIQITLDFFKSIDEELYERAKSIIERNSDFEFNIYYKDEISPELFDTKREDGMPLYSSFGSVYGTNDKRGMYIPCERSIRDVFVLVHEISHTFDYCEPDTPTRNLFGEVTSYVFEAMLQHYLLKNSLISREDAINIEKGNMISHYDDGVETYAKLILMRLKESKGKDGKIEEEDLIQIQNQYHISCKQMDYIIHRMMGKNAHRNVDFRARYMTAQLVYPYVMEQYYCDSQLVISNLKQYFEDLKENDFNGAVRALGMEPKEEFITTLIQCNNRRIERIYRKRLFDEQTKASELKENNPFFRQTDVELGDN